MSSITNGEIREALAQALNSISGLNIYRYPPEDVNPPCAFIAGFTINPLTFDGNRETKADVTVLVSHKHVDQLVTLDAMLDSDGPWSVVDAIESATPPGMNFFVENIGGYRELTVGDVGYYAADVSVTVRT
jgi:hypothetical protein